MNPREIHKLVEDYIGVSGGYLNFFSYSLHDRFYHTYCDLDFDVPSYRQKGLTTRTAFVQILKDAQPRAQAKIIRGVFEMIPLTKFAEEEMVKKKKVYDELNQIAVRLESDGEVETPILVFTSETVFAALKDAEILLKNSGPTSAVDRAHTALHGYLKRVCDDRNISLLPDLSLTALFKVFKEQLPEFSTVFPHDQEAKRVLGSLSSALDSLNTIRNRGTLAHPNELLLEASEAMLYINLSRAVLSYFNSKLKSRGT